MVLVKNKNVIITEFTCCLETSFKVSRQCKIKSYENWPNDCIPENFAFCFRNKKHKKLNNPCEENYKIDVNRL